MAGVPVGLPGGAVVRGKGLLPVSRGRRDLGPLKRDADGFAGMGVVAEKLALAPLEAAGHRRLEVECAVVGPVDAPESGFWFEEAMGAAFVWRAVWRGGTERIDVSDSPQNRLTNPGRFEFLPAVRVVEPAR